MSEARQRWRLVVARGPAARELVHRDVIAAWDTGLRSSGLPIAESEGASPRPKIVYAAPAPVGMLAEGELIDVFLTERLRIPDVRAAVARAAPPGYTLVDLHDVWIDAPTLPSLVVAADYRAELVPSATDPAEIEGAIRTVLAAARLERRRAKGQGEVAVDVRPHIETLRLAGTDHVPATPTLRMRLRLGGEGGVGRPDEVIAAIEDVLGRSLPVMQVVRERIVLAEDPPA